MKIHPVRAELFHADGLTDRRDAFGNFANAPKKRKLIDVAIPAEGNITHKKAENKI
jgi:hypothetical protein